MNKKSKLTEEQVKHVAKLAKLTLSSGEIKKFQKQLSAILDYISQLKEVDTRKVEPTSQITGLENIFKKDNKDSSLTQKQALSGSKNIHEGMFKVKAIFE